jgi:hypothetical protein
VTEPGKHPSAEELAQYAARTLPVSALLNVDDHLATCAECRAAIAKPAAGRLSLDDHLTYEQLEAMAEGREPVDAHARECAMCGAELKDLRTVADRRRWSRLPWWMPAGAAAAAGIAIYALVMSQPGSVEAPKAPVVAARPFAAEVEAALATGQVVPVPGTPDWRREREQLLGDTAPAPGPGSVIGPVAETVDTDRPLFRWTAVKGVPSYRVEVYDAQFNEVARSGAVAGTQWFPEKALPRGATYTWVVEAGSTRFPQPPAPEAKFAVLGADGAAELNRARVDGSKLAVAVVAARYGLWEEARGALESAAREHPEDAGRIERLKNSLRAR